MTSCPSVIQCVSPLRQSSDGPAETLTHTYILTYQVTASNLSAETLLTNQAEPASPVYWQYAYTILINSSESFVKVIGRTLQ